MIPIRATRNYKFIAGLRPPTNTFISFHRAELEWLVCPPGKRLTTLFQKCDYIFSKVWDISRTI